MTAGVGAFPHRVFVPDSRGDEFFLRVTYHEPERLFVVSTWEHDRCTAAIRIPVSSAPELVTLLVNGLASAAGAPSTTTTAAAS